MEPLSQQAAESNQSNVTNQADKNRSINIATDAEAEIVNKIVKRKQAIKTNRIIFERQWLINIAFLYGKHYFMVEKKALSGLEERIAWELQSLERKKKTRRVVNYILPLYRSLLARMLMMKSTTLVEPGTQSSRDIDCARVSKEALEDFWLTCNRENSHLSQKNAGMLQVLQKLFGYMLCVGSGYLKPYFNPHSNAKIHIQGETFSAPVGQVEVDIINPFDVFRDPMHRFDIQQKIMPVEALETKYGVKVEPEDIGMGEMEKQLMSLLEGSYNERYEDSARVYEYYEPPNSKYPDGLFIVSTEKKILEKNALPEEYKGRIPLFQFNYLDIMMAPYPQSMIEQLIPCQEDYNFTINRINEYKKWMAGKVKVPKYCKLETRYDDEMGQVIKYDPAGGEPHFEQGPSAPPFLEGEIMRIRKDMEDIAAVHDVSMSRLPSDVKSGVAIENLSELDNSQLAPVLHHVEQQLSFFADTVLNIMEHRYSEERLLNVCGDYMTKEVKTFKGDALSGNRNTKISLGSAMPTSRQARQAFILQLSDKGYIEKPVALKLLEFGQEQGLYTDVNETGEKAEIGRMALGDTNIVPKPWENHAKRLSILTNFMMTPDFEKLGADVMNIFVNHMKMHQQMLMQEMQVAQGPGGGQPGPAAPSGPGVGNTGGGAGPTPQPPPSKQETLGAQ